MFQEDYTKQQTSRIKVNNAKKSGAPQPLMKKTLEQTTLDKLQDESELILLLAGLKDLYKTGEMSEDPSFVVQKEGHQRPGTIFPYGLVTADFRRIEDSCDKVRFKISETSLKKGLRYTGSHLKHIPVSSEYFETSKTTRTCGMFCHCVGQILPMWNTEVLIFTNAELKDIFGGIMDHNMPYLVIKRSKEPMSQFRLPRSEQRKEV